MQRTNCYRIIVLLAGLGLFISQPDAAQAISYFDVNGAAAGSGVTNGGSYLWNSGGQTNWSTDSTGGSATSAGAWTGASDHATFVAGADGTGKSYTITLTGGGAQTRMLDLTVNGTGGNPTIAVNGGNLFPLNHATWTVPAGNSLSISGVGNGTWGALNMNSRTLTLNVDGALTINGVGNGGTILMSGAGTATIGGTSSFNVNPSASAGTLNLDVTSTLSASVISATGTGVVNVNGTISSGAIAATTGSGVINVNGTLSAAGLQVSQSSAGANSFVNVNAGGTLNLSGGVLVGQNASNSTGTLTIKNGGVFNANNADFRVANAVNGPTQTGILNLEAGSALNLNAAGSVLRVGNGSVTNGTVNLDGGTLFINGQIRGDAPVGASAGTNTFNLNGGMLKAGVNHANFLQGMDAANVRNGGAKFDTNGFNITVAQAMQHSAIGGDLATDGGLTKTGAGTLTLSGNNTYTGATNIDAGTLALSHSSNSNIATSSAIVVNGTLNVSGLNSGRLDLAAGQTLSGGGTIVGAMALTSGAIVAPGNSPGALFADNFNWQSGGSYQWEVAAASGAAGTDWDLLDLTGDTLSFTGGGPFLVNIDASGATGFVDGSYLFEIARAGSISGFDAGQFTLTANGPSMTTWSIVQQSNSIFLQADVAAAVPEPGTMALCAFGFLLCGAAARRRRAGC